MSNKGGKEMENYFYECSLCNFVHIVPAYWVSFDPEEEMMFPHICPETKEDCENTILKLQK